jgi:GNAT superfamily N-acetyltransferase
MLADHALSARIEAVEASTIEGVVRAVQSRIPDLGAAVLAIAGGRAGFVGPGARISRAAGLGLIGPVSGEDVEALEVSPFADPSLFEHLGERGFRLVELDTVLVRRIEPAGLRATAYFFAASTVPAFRGRGVQGALIEARLALAAEAGCDLGYTVTAAGSASQRHFERAGFIPAYSQALLVKPYSTRAIS